MSRGDNDGRFLHQPEAKHWHGAPGADHADFEIGTAWPVPTFNPQMGILDPCSTPNLGFTVPSGELT